MVRAKTVAIGAGIAGLIGIGAAVVATAKPPSVPPSGTIPPTATYTVNLSTPTPSAPAGATVPFMVTLLENGNPVPGNAVTLLDITTHTSSTTNTDSSGVASFDVVFPNAGNYSIQASAKVP